MQDEADRDNEAILNQGGYLTQCLRYNVVITPVLQTLVSFQGAKAAVGFLYRIPANDGMLYPIARAYGIGMN